MLFIINSLVSTVNDFLYQPFIVPLLLIAAGLVFSLGSGFLQLRYIPEMFRSVMEKPDDDQGISSFGALMVSTASRVGTGNIIGVSTAICLGGPGSIFWMWITAILGSASAFAESTLAQIYKRRDKETGTCYGGPSYYMESGLHQRWLGVIFSAFILLTYAVGYNLLASYNLQSAFSGFRFYSEKTTPAIIGIVLAVLFMICIMGGAKRLTQITGVLVPLMGVIYIAVSILVVLMNFHNIGPMFQTILSNAFNIQAIFAGFSGSCIMYGIKRGLYSNEAGMGSAPNASASAEVSHPAKQGLVQVLSVYLDTILVCSATALMCMSTGVTPAEELSGAPFVQEALRSVFGTAGPVFIAVAMCLFGFTTLIGNFYYTEGCLRFIMNRKPGKTFLMIFKLFCTFIVFIGAVASVDLAWNLADMCQGLMVIVNVPTILILGGTALKCLKNYTSQLKEGKEPTFRASDIGIQEELDYWK